MSSLSWATWASGSLCPNPRWAWCSLLGKQAPVWRGGEAVQGSSQILTWQSLGGPFGPGKRLLRRAILLHHSGVWATYCPDLSKQGGGSRSPAVPSLPDNLGVKALTAVALTRTLHSQVGLLWPPHPKQAPPNYFGVLSILDPNMTSSHWSPL